MQKSTRQIIDEFLAVRRFAMVGVSSRENHFSRSLFDEFLKNGYDVVPVNPRATGIGGVPAFKTLSDIIPAVNQALVVTPDDQVMDAVKAAHVSGVARLWLYGISGTRDISPDVLKYCGESDMEVIPGYCPFMFLPQAAGFHKFHGIIWRLIGRYPK